MAELGLQRLWARILGIVLLLVGIVGFFVSGNLLGFGVNSLHNVVHLLSGVLGIWAGWSTMKYAKMYNTVFGLVYLLVTILGFAGLLGGLLGVNAADNWLHLVIALVTLGVGFFAKN